MLTDTPGVPQTAALNSRALPSWPFAALFIGYPLWWALGLSTLLIPLIGALCLFLMSARGWIRMPSTWLWWIGFLGWALASAIMIDTSGRMIGFTQRLIGVTGALLIVLYVYNAWESLPRRRALGLMALFMTWLAIGGYLGIFFPEGRIPTAALALAPPTLANNEYVVELLSPRFAEVQNPYGARSAFVRPSAPFPYTNAWGHTFVLLIPVILAVAVRASLRTRLILLAMVAVAIPPALATLNRGIVVGLAVAAAYWAVRFRRYITLARVSQLTLLGLVVTGVVIFSGVLNRVTERTSTSTTTEDRATLYRETFQRALESPLLGFGAPRPSYTLQVSVGTQGHFWYVLFSHGFVGLILFLGGVWGMAWATRGASGAEEIFMHTPIVVMSVTLLFYGIDPLHLVITLSCAVLLLRKELDTSLGHLPIQRRRTLR